MSTPESAPQGRVAQVLAAYRNTKRFDPRIGLILLGTFLGTGVLVGAVSWLLMGGTLAWLRIVLAVVLAIAAGALAATWVFGRRAEKVMYAQAEGQLGAAAGALQLLRGAQWVSKPAIAASKNQDVVHRLIGRPGVVLVGEGSRVQKLLATEATKHARIVGEGVTVTTISVGRGEGEVPLDQLVRTIRKLPKNIKAGEQTEVINKLKALDAMRPTMPMPRGPVPTSMKGARRQMRG